MGLETLCARADAHGIGAISLHAAAAGPEAVDSAHRHGLRLWAWTADTPEDWRRLSEAGVDGIITNQPCRPPPLERVSRPRLTSQPSRSRGRSQTT